ncbi:type II secretion system protein N [Aquabacterium sp.]|uniref:type II secretion system protein N n=1 Tax=Aquabacterium sp. TaxID=1872578 RepID=UPI0035B16294
MANLQRAPWRLSRLGRKRAGPAAANTGAASRWLESTLEVARWDRVRRASARWGAWGAALGGLFGVVAYAPASWVASALSGATDGHLVLADAQGTIWSGSAVSVLTGGPGSRDARSLPGRLSWVMRPRVSGGLGVSIAFTHACCLNGQPQLIAHLGLGRITAHIENSPEGEPGLVGQWPAAWLAGLGTPWNTLDLGGTVRMTSQGFGLEWVQGRVRVSGQAEVALRNVSSRVTTLDHLGSYRLTIDGQSGNGSAAINLFTEEGALQLTGSGAWGPGGFHFRGDAAAREAERGALDNLLNIIGRRAGERSIISIG